MKFLTTLFILSITPFFLMAQNKLLLSGKITDNEGNALSGANISIDKSKAGTISAADGSYSLLLFPDKTYTINIDFMGFESVTKNVSMNNSEQTINFKLNESTIVSDEVVVYSTRANSKMPVVSQTLNTDKLRKNNTAQDIPYLLALTPSFVSTSETGTGIGYTSMRIRGVDPSRINVTVNGIPLNDSESQGVYWVNMPDFSSSVNDVQIQRGVGTSTNGPAAFGATVNFRTTGIEKKPHAEISSIIGSYNTFQETVKIGTGLINEHFSFDMRYSKLNADAYIDHGFSDHHSLFMGAAWHSNKSMIKAQVISGNQKTGITWWGVPDYMIDKKRTHNPAGEYIDVDGKLNYYDDQTDNYKQTHIQLFFVREFNKNLNMNIALHSTLGKGYYEQYKSNEKLADYGILSNPVISSDLIRQKWLDNVFGGLVYSLNYSIKNLDFSMGGTYNSYKGDHYGNILWVENNPPIEKNYEWYNNVGEKSEASSYIKGIYTTDDYKLSIFGDIQYRGINYKLEGLDDDLTDLTQEHNYNFINPKAGIKYRLSKDLSLYGSFGIANREPTRADIKDATKNNGKSIPTNETLYDYEAGININKLNYSFGANFFYMNYKDQLVNTGKLNSVGYPIMSNVPKSYRMGLELIGGLQLIEGLSWESNLTLSENIIKNHKEFMSYNDINWNSENKETNYGDTKIAFSPSIIASSIYSYEYKDYSISLDTKYVGAQYFDNTMSDMRKLDAYLLNNLHLKWKHKFEKYGTMAIQFSINNLFSEKYISNAYGGAWFEEKTDTQGEYDEKSWAYYFPQAPRHYMLKLNFSF